MAEQPYCKSWNAGLASETKAVCRKLGRLFDAIDAISGDIVGGAIRDDLLDFRHRLRERLLAEGWQVSYEGGDRMKVRPPPA